MFTMRRGLQVLRRKATTGSSAAAAAAARSMAPKAAFSSGASITVDLSKAFDLHSTYNK
jgi:cobalamin biosynthesis protein CbiD